MKRKTARELLAESFREPAQEKTVDAITVREIVERCGYSAATFYRHFRDKNDLIAWEHSRRVAAIMERVGHDGYTWKQTLRDGALMFERERDYLANLLRHTSGHDAFIHYKTQINYDALKRLICSVSGRQELDSGLELIVRIYVFGTVALSCEWILGECRATPEELAESFYLSLPAPLRPYLLEE